MLVFAQDDLNKGNLNSAGGASSTANSVANNVLNSTAGFDLGQINAVSIVAWANLLVLAWTIFYSFILLAYFIDHRVFFSGGELAAEKEGMKGIYWSMRLWWSYVFTLPFFAGFALLSTNLPSFSLLAAVLMVLIYLTKIVYDLPWALGIYSYFGWSDAIAKSIINLTKFKK